MSMYVIYKYESPTGLIYIGKTSENRVNIRKSEHKKRAKIGEKSAFYNSIRKYGFEVHKYEILYYVDTEEKAYEIEKLLIKKYNSYINGLNSSMGGIGVGSGENHPLFGVNGDKHHNYNNRGIKSTNYKGDIIAKHTLTGEEIILRGKHDIINNGFIYSDVIKCTTGCYKTHKKYTFSRQPLNK